MRDSYDVYNSICIEWEGDTLVVANQFLFTSLPGLARSRGLVNSRRPAEIQCVSPRGEAQGKLGRPILCGSYLLQAVRASGVDPSGGVKPPNQFMLNVIKLL